MCGFCEVAQSVSSSVAGLYWASAAARLHRVGDQALVDDALLDDDVGRFERRVHVAAADRPLETDVVGHVGVELRLSLGGRLLGVDDGRQRLVVDLDGFDRVAGDVAVGRDDDRHGVADVAHVSMAMGGYGGVLMLSSARPTRTGIGPKPASLMSAPVKTPRTPGIAAAFFVRMALIFACA